GRLPHTLAVPLDEYALETNAYVKLHRLCDAAEMLTRFLAVVALAELHEAGRPFPAALRAALLDGIERPTFGVWTHLLRLASREVAGVDDSLVPELPRLTADLLGVVAGARGTAETALLPLRNALAHDGRFTGGRARHLLDGDGHRRRFEGLWAGACG